MLQTAANTRLAARFASAGIPLLAPAALPTGTEQPVIVTTPRGEVAFTVLPAPPARVAATRVGSNLIPLIGLPAVVLEASEATTIDIAVLALLSVLTPSLASDYVGLLERLAAIERAAHRRFGTLLPLPPGPFLRWSDALDALTGRRFLPWVAARRRLVAAQRHFWRHLRRQVEPEGQRRARRRSPPLWPRRFR
ncbi:MAG: hypothetical protein K6U89_18705 [Chloroflexi bacterium]|nr:hypothetical protein [Chloroflexota bacterium]